MKNYNNIMYSIVFGLWAGLSFLLSSCGSDVAGGDVQRVEDGGLQDSIVFESFGVDSPDFIYRSANKAVIYRPGLANQLLVGEQGASVVKIENIVGEGPGLIPYIDLYGFGSDSTVFVCGGSKYLLFDFAGNLLKSTSFDAEKSTPDYSIGQNSQLNDKGEVIFAAIDNNLYLDQKTFVELSHSVSCLNVESGEMSNTGYMTPASVYLTGKFDYNAPLVSSNEDELYVLYLDDARFVYKHGCNGDSLGKAPLNISNWETDNSTRDENTLEARLNAYQKNSSFLQLYVSDKYILTVHIMPSEMENVSSIIEEVKENNGYRKRYASIFPIEGGDPICTIDLSNNYGVAGLDGNAVVLYDINRMEQSNDFTLLKYSWML